jgi:hypothetical protein
MNDGAKETRDHQITKFPAAVWPVHFVVSLRCWVMAELGKNFCGMPA